MVVAAPTAAPSPPGSHVSSRGYVWMDDAEWMSSIDGRLRDAGRALLSAAWARLRDEHVVPPPVFHPYIEVGRDYFGDSIRCLAEYRALRELIEKAHPRFHADQPLDARTFPDGYIFSFLEMYVARLTAARDEFSPHSPAAEQSLRDLIQAVHADTFEVACCRVVSHMTTVDGRPIDFTNVRVEPVVSDAAGHSRELRRIIGAVIPSATSAYGRVDPGGFAPPESVVIARDIGPKPFDLNNPLSNRIERFMLLVRLLKPGTSESMYEVQGETHAVREFKPIMMRFRGAGPGFASPTQLAPRAITLGADDAGRVDGLGRLLDVAQRATRPEMMFTSFGMAVHKFLLSYHAHVWYEQIVDLATAFEAVLSGTAKEDVTLRLRTRAATLLSTDRDPADKIFRDVGVIYNLRSKLVHGGAMKDTYLLKEIRKISTVPADVLDGQAVAHCVERLRDLVRRSLLARICLAAGDTPLWARDTDEGVDAVMADDKCRIAWRAAWRDALTSIDAINAADPPLRQLVRSGVDYDKDHEAAETQDVATPRHQD